MCGRFYLDAKADELAAYFDLPAVPSLKSRYDLAPSQPIMVIRAGERGQEYISPHWGLIPFWVKDEKISYRTINSRPETAESKLVLKAAFKYRRSLIPASGFYEWAVEKLGKQPYCIHPKRGSLFVFDGLYENWEGEAGKIIDSCIILLTEANLVIAPVYDRMPVILYPSNFDAWLDPNTQDPAILKALLRSALENDIAVYSVSRHVSNPRSDAPTCSFSSAAPSTKL